MEKGISSKTGNGIVDVPPKQLATRMNEVGKHLDALDALLADARPLGVTARREAIKLRGPEEAIVLQGVIEFAAGHTPLFEKLADEDEGADPSTFETALVSGRLANAQTLIALAERLGKLHQQVSDAALRAGTLSKPVALKAYAIAKIFMVDDPQEALVTPAVDFYTKPALAGAKTRKEHKGEAASDASATTPAATGNTPTK